ncbi:MAG: 2-C-methyl-D-erythritol 4-phosphate cytidylyltransferase, partial [Acetobacteraceae bacterium]
MSIAALLLAAGSGLRFGAATPKQFLPLLGRPVIRHAAEALAAHVAFLQPVGATEPIDAALAGLPHLGTVPGGATRQVSTRAGLEALAPHAPTIVLVHDAARPHIPPGTIPALLAALEKAPGAIPALAVTDTLKRAGPSGAIEETVPRAGVFRAQTPQAFHFATLLRLHRAAGNDGATDDAALLEAAGLTVALVAGSEVNIKITIPDDLSRLTRLLAPTFVPSAPVPSALVPRTGLGFDVHAFA